MQKRKERGGWLRLLGPGLVTGAADDDPSGVATYSQAGAAFGYGLLWVVLLTTPLMLAVQLVSARIGRVTGAGVIANARLCLSRRAVAGLVILLLIANVANIAADLAAMGEALELALGGGQQDYVLAIGVAGLVAQVLAPYRLYAAFLRWTTLALFGYVAAAFAVDVDWRSAALGAISPTAPWTPQAMMMILAVLGTTISPYLFVWQAAQEIEEMGVRGRAPLRDAASARSELRRLRLDTSLGVVLSNIVAFFIILTTAATLHAHGITDIDSSGKAAQALRPLAGDFAFLLFALGIVGTGLLAIPVLAGSAAYAVSEAFGGSFSLEAPFRTAPGFYGIVIVATLGGAALDFTPIEPMRLLIWTALMNGAIAPPFLAAMMIVASNREVMGAQVSPTWLKTLGWTATAAMTLAVLLLAFSMIG